MFILRIAVALSLKDYVSMDQQLDVIEIYIKTSFYLNNVFNIQLNDDMRFSQSQCLSVLNDMPDSCPCKYVSI